MCARTWRAAPLFVAGAFGGGQISFQRRLGVHYDALAARQANQQIRPQPAIFGGDYRLRVEIAALQHAGHLHHAFELHFAPTSPHARRPEGAGQTARLGSQLDLSFEQRADLLGQSGICSGARRLHFVYVAIYLCQRFANRPHQVGYSLLAEFQVAAGALLSSFQRRLGQIQERLVVGLQGLGRQSLEGVGQLLPCVIQGRLQFLVLPIFVLQALVQDSPLRLPLGLGAVVGLAGRRPKQCPGQQHTQRDPE